MPLADRSENGRGDLAERKAGQQDKKLFRHRFKRKGPGKVPDHLWMLA